MDVTFVVFLLTVSHIPDRILSTLRYFVRVDSIDVSSSRYRTMKVARTSFGFMREGMMIMGAFCLLACSYSSPQYEC